MLVPAFVLGLVVAVGWAMQADPPAFPPDRPLYRIAVNHADAPTLTLLSGIGPAKAQAMIDARHARPFTDADDLRRAHGVGSILAQRMASHLRFD
jgi:DNA uptake protein ComE-like DNA-binding protein